MDITSRVLEGGITKNRSARFLYFMLLRECDGGSTCSPSIQRLMRLTTMSHEEILAFLRPLEEQGFVISTRNPDRTGPDEPTEYFLPKLKEAIDEYIAKKNRKSSPGTRSGPVAS